MNRPVFELEFTAASEHIDELGHVNNAVWVQWIQTIAVAHWHSVCDPAHHDSYFWVVVRHEIDYLRAAFEGDRLLGQDLGRRRTEGRPLRPSRRVRRPRRESLRSREDELGDHRPHEQPPDPRPGGGDRALRRCLADARNGSPHSFFSRPCIPRLGSDVEAASCGKDGLAKRNDIAPYERPEARRWTRIADYWPDADAHLGNIHWPKPGTLREFSARKPSDAPRRPSRRGLLLPIAAVLCAVSLSIWGSGMLAGHELSTSVRGGDDQSWAGVRPVQRRRPHQLRRQRRQLLSWRQDRARRRDRSSPALRRRLSRRKPPSAASRRRRLQAPAQFRRARNDRRSGRTSTATASCSATSPSTARTSAGRWSPPAWPATSGTSRASWC